MEGETRKHNLLEQRMTMPSKSMPPQPTIPFTFTFYRRLKVTDKRHVVIEKFRDVTYVKIRDYTQAKKKGFPLVPVEEVSNACIS